VAAIIPKPPAFKVAAGFGGKRRLVASRQYGVLVDEPPPKNPWEPYKLKLFPKTINERRYWPGDTVYRRWILSPGGGYYMYGDEFDYLRWQP
jgi:hypothetical protein